MHLQLDMEEVRFAEVLDAIGRWRKECTTHFP